MLLIKGSLTLIPSRQTLIYSLKCFMKNGMHQFHSLVTSLMKKMSHVPSIGNTLSRIDICNYLGGQMYPAARLAFCPITYKPPSSDDEMNSKNAESCNGWTALQRDLSIAAHDTGNPIVSNGS
jgi:hypothetical protein